jgi:uncharacterized protein involved in exopolysaccharide biosynthesis
MTKHNKAKSVREIFSEEEVSLIDLIRLFTDRRKYIFIFVPVFFLIGVLIAITSPVEYQSESQVLSEDGGGEGSGLSGLAGLAGLAGIQVPEASQGSSGLSPSMYPTIAHSEPFLLNLMKETFYFQEKQKEMSLYEYFSEERPGHIFSKTFDFFKGIPGRFFRLFEREKTWETPKQFDADTVANGGSGEQKQIVIPKIVSISSTQKYVMDQLASRIDIEAEGRIIDVKVKMPEPYISAQLNNIVLEKVLEYVISYKTEKQRQNLEFVQERTLEAEAKFKAAQLRLASFRDANQGMVTQTARTKEEQLQADFNLASSIYSGLAQQLEQTKIQLKKETPLFTEFEPVSVPLTKSEPVISKIIISYIALGVLFGGLSIFISIGRSFLKSTLQS